ncbi:uncharacterized protein BJ171DRAFT_566920 [Polychytrium aggregatum]|uniref:uncharacterized protein n=1 Tax=Polychytrium aggregatum TaxID=110093 RepID=UPI0022FEF44D|nr:uncharacterized protein BJ171DRAFT_566920 [Polychytrium aggregatum]KAI9206087.1 hypothetical protein BJ171DRAFT_566920 [Polychytrium aggregatum]
MSPPWHAPKPAPPPADPALHKVIDTAAAYVARNSSDFIKVLRDRQPSYHFLWPNGPHSDYFEWKLHLLRSGDGLASSPAAPARAPPPTEELVAAIPSLTDEKIQELVSLTDSICQDCSQANIQAGKAWITSNCSNQQHMEATMAFIVRSMTGRDSFEGRLHLLYLVNDVLYFGCRLNESWIRTAIHRSLPTMLSLVYAASEGDKQKADKVLKAGSKRSRSISCVEALGFQHFAPIAKVLSIWKDKGYFDAQTIEEMRHVLVGSSSSSAAATTSSSPSMAVPGFLPQPAGALPIQPYATEAPPFTPPTVAHYPAGYHVGTGAPNGFAGMSSPHAPFQAASAHVPMPLLPGAVSATAISPRPIALPMPVAITPPAVLAGLPISSYAPAPIGVRPPATVTPVAAPAASPAPSQKYHELPAGLMVPLTKAAEKPYGSIHADDVKMPATRPPPTEELLKAVEDYYRGIEKQREALAERSQRDGFEEDAEVLAGLHSKDPDNADRPTSGTASEIKIDREGWQLGLLDEFYSNLETARKRFEEEARHRKHDRDVRRRRRGQSSDESMSYSRSRSRHRSQSRSRSRSYSQSRSRDRSRDRSRGRSRSRSRSGSFSPGRRRSNDRYSRSPSRGSSYESSNNRPREVGRSEAGRSRWRQASPNRSHGYSRSRSGSRDRSSRSPSRDQRRARGRSRDSGSASPRHLREGLGTRSKNEGSTPGQEATFGLGTIEARSVGLSGSDIYSDYRKHKSYTMQRDVGPQGREPVGCYRCGKVGHIARDCT